MKKIICLMLAGIMCISLYSCKEEEDINNENVEQEEVEEEETEADTELEKDDMKKQYDLALDLLEKKDYEGAYGAFNKCKGYKEADKYLECFTYLPRIAKKIGETSYSYEYEYTINGYETKLIESVIYVPYGSYKEGDIINNRVYEYVFDDKGRIVKKIENDNGEVSETEYIYNDYGVRIGAVYTRDGSVISSFMHEYYYDSEGKLIKEVTGDETFDKYEYDAEGKLIKTTGRSYNDRSELFDHTTLYEYDGNNVVRETYTCSTGEKTICEYKYNKKDLLIEEKITSDKVKKKIEYNYTDFGALSRICVSYDGVESKIVTLDYNENGKLTDIEDKHFNSGTWNTAIKYKFTYNALGAVCKLECDDGFGVETREYSDFVLCYDPNTFSDRNDNEYFYHTNWNFFKICNTFVH